MAGSEEARYPPSSERELRIAKPFMRLFSTLNTWVFRASGGRVGKRFPGGAPVGLLTVTGRKSGRRRTIPLIYGRDGDRLVLVASQGGMPRHPVWYLNLAAHPQVEFEIGRDRRAYRARTAGADERVALWEVACRVHPDFDEYRKRTDREIPVVVLDPA